MSIVIFEDTKEFARAQTMAKQKKTIFKELLEEVSKFITIEKSEIKEFKEDPYKFFKQAFLKKHKDKNTLDLSFEKLTYLLDLNTYNVNLLSNKYLEIEVDEDVKESDFIQLAKTPEQIKRFTEVKELCDVIMKIKGSLSPRLNLTAVMTAFNPMIQLDQSTITIHPNPYWVINGDK